MNSTRTSDGQQDTPVLDTSRLYLRPFQPGDAERMVAFYGDPRVMAIRKLGVLGPLAARAELESIMAHWREHGFGLWAVLERASRVFVGECGLRWLEDGTEVELSYGLVPAARGRGYATEAARAVLAHAFDSLALPRVVALSNGTNRDSHRVLEKCGMRLLWRRDGVGGGLVKYMTEAPGSASPTQHEP